MVHRVVVLPLAALVISIVILGGISLAFGVADPGPTPVKTVTTLETASALARDEGETSTTTSTAAESGSEPTDNELNVAAPTPDITLPAPPSTTATTQAAAATPTTTTTTSGEQQKATTTTPASKAEPKPKPKPKPTTTTTTKPPKSTPTTTAPPKSTPPPSGDVVDIYPGDNVNAILQAHPKGTTFLMHAGVYKRVTLMPKSDQTIVGQKGTILDGEGKAEDGVGRASANNITIRGLTIKNYKDKCIDWGAPGAGYNWTIEDTEVSYCGTGIKVKKGGTYKNNYVHHNRKYGMNGNGVDLTVVGNEIAFNRTNSKEWLGDSGGTKFLRTERLVIRNNHVHDNYGNGIWVDGSNQGALIEKNTVTNNERVGIFHELGFAPTIRNNTVKGNGFKTDGSGGGGAGILVLASKGAKIYNNTVTNNRNGIMAKWNDLHAGRNKDNLTGATFYLKDIYVHHNVVTMKVGTTGIVDYSNAQKSYTSGWNNRFENNTYKLDKAGGDYFRWKDADPNKAGYQLLNHSEWKEIHPKD